MKLLDENREALQASEYVFEKWYDGIVTGAVHCCNFGWHYLWMVEQSLFCKLRIYRAIPIDQYRVLELVRIGIEVGGVSGYECFDDERQSLPPLLSEDITQSRQEQKSNMDRELYEKSIVELEDAIWDSGVADLRYLAADPYMVVGYWLSILDVPNLEFEQAAGQTYWNALTADLDQKS